MSLPHKPLPKRIAIAVFQNRLDRDPKPADLPWRTIVERFKAHWERASKDGPLWSPTDYCPDGRRGNRDVERLTCAVLDFDKGKTRWTDVKPLLEGLAYVAHSTYSHTPEAPCFRVAIPLAEPVAKHDWPDAWRRIHAIFGGDPAAKDPARIYYQPSHRPEAAFWSETGEGQALDVWELPFVAALDGGFTAGGLDPEAILEGIEEGSRNETLFRYASRLRGMGMSENEARLLVLAAAARCKPPLPEQEAEGIVSRVFSVYQTEVEKGLASLEYVLDTLELEPDQKDDLRSQVEQLASNSGEFAFYNMVQWADKVRSMPDPGWLATRVWPADAYGVVAAADKAGKTWAMSDLAISKATGTPWMDLFEVPRPGRVLVFFGEGGERKLWRRMQAIAAWKERKYGRTISLELLAIRACFRVPQFTNDYHMNQVKAELGLFPADLVILDPLYLAASGADGGNLYEMGKHLYRIQELVQSRSEPTALVIVTHFKKGEDEGYRRISGVGPGAWGRVLATATVADMPDSDALGDQEQTSVQMTWEFKGDEISETKKVVQRRVWSEDPDDLTARLHYELRELETVPEEEALSENARRVENVLLAADVELATGTVREKVNVDGKRALDARAVQRALQDLVKRRRAERVSGDQRNGFTWRSTVVTDISRFED